MTAVNPSKFESKMVKVLIPVAQFPLDHKQIRGGVHSALLNLLSGFSKKDVQVRVLSFSVEAEKTQQITFSPNIEIVYEPEGYFPFHSINYLFNGPALLKKHIRLFQPDIIHFQTGNTLLFSKLTGLGGIPHLITIHGISLEEMKRKSHWGDKLKWIFNGYMNKILLPKNIIHLSEFSKKKIRVKNKSHQTLIPNAVSDAFFQIPKKTEFENRLLFVGVLNENKNVHYLINRLYALKNKGYQFELHVLGGFVNEVYRSKIEEMIDTMELGDQVHLHGWSSQDKVMKYLEHTDILILTSQHEMLPMVIAEAQSAARTVLASAVGGITEMIDDRKNGFTFNLSDPQSFEQILEKLLDDSKTTQIVAEKAREKAISSYESGSVAEKTIDFYKEIMIR